MQLAILEIGNINELNLITDLANKNGIKSKILDMDDYEDFAFGLLIEEGKQSDFIDKDNFINNLKNATKN